MDALGGETVELHPREFNLSVYHTYQEVNNKYCRMPGRWSLHKSHITCSPQVGPTSVATVVSLVPIDGDSALLECNNMYCM